MTPRIGLVVSSVRKPRICPQIAQFVRGSIKATLADNDKKPELRTIDLAEWNLPMFDEPWIPSLIKDPSQYAHEHTRAWSREITSYDAFIFVSPQYNWGYPASLKNAIDYLFNEGVGKPAMIVTYGGHGGGKCAEQLRSVLEGIRMLQTPSHVELKYPDMQWAKQKAFLGG